LNKIPGIFLLLLFLAKQQLKSVVTFLWQN